MASTNKTSNLQLSQFIATDTPTWLVDYNGDMEKIDAGVGRVEELAETAKTQAVGVASGLQTTNQNVATLSGQVANVQNQANSTTASVNGINQRLGNTDISGVGDGTVTGAINALSSAESGFSAPNPANVIKSETNVSGGTSASYTATNDSFLYIRVNQYSAGNGTQITIGGVQIASFINYDTADPNNYFIITQFIPIKKGDVVNISAGSNSNISYTVFGVR